MDKITTSEPTIFTFFSEIGIVDQLATNLMERYLPQGLTLPQYSVLSHFTREEGEHTPYELARAFQVTKGAMTNTLKKLESHGFISVKDDPGDGRRKLVSITETGRDALTESAVRLRPVAVMLEDHVRQEDIGKFVPFLRDLRHYLDEHRVLPT